MRTSVARAHHAQRTRVVYRKVSLSWVKGMIRVFLGVKDRVVSYGISVVNIIKLLIDCQIELG